MAKFKNFVRGTEAVKEDVMAEVSEVQAELVQPEETEATPQVVEPKKGKLDAAKEWLAKKKEKADTVCKWIGRAALIGGGIFAVGKGISYINGKKDVSNENIQNDQDRSEEYDDPELQSLIEMEKQEEEKTE